MSSTLTRELGVFNYVTDVVRFLELRKFQGLSFALINL